MKCKVCGAEVGSGDKYCPDCGSYTQDQNYDQHHDPDQGQDQTLRSLIRYENGASRDSQNGNNQKSRSGFSRKAAIVIAFLGVLLLIATVSVICLIVKNRKNSREVRPAEEQIVAENNSTQQADIQTGSTAAQQTDRSDDNRETQTTPEAPTHSPVTNNSSHAYQGVADSAPEYRSYPGMVIKYSKKYSADAQYIQSVLICLGYNCGSSGADGYYGFGTLTAVRSFQINNSISADGQVGPVTWNMLQTRLRERTESPVSLDNVCNAYQELVVSHYSGKYDLENAAPDEIWSYTIIDLDRDGVPELITLGPTGEELGPADMYTYLDGKVVLLTIKNENKEVGDDLQGGHDNVLDYYVYNGKLYSLAGNMKYLSYEKSGTTVTRSVYPGNLTNAPYLHFYGGGDMSGFESIKSFG